MVMSRSIYTASASGMTPVVRSGACKSSMRPRRWRRCTSSPCRLALLALCVDKGHYPRARAHVAEHFACRDRGAGERWPWVTEVLGLRAISLLQAPTRNDIRFGSERAGAVVHVVFYAVARDLAHAAIQVVGVQDCSGRTHKQLAPTRAARRPAARRARRACRGEGPIPREVDRASPSDREAARGRERLRATLVVREDDTFPAKSPGAGPGERGGRAVEQPS